MTVDDWCCCAGAGAAPGLPGAVPGPAPGPEPVSSFGFPPGLLPALCKRRRESGAKPYEPLEPDEIEAMGE